MRFRSYWPAVLWSGVILILSFSSGKSFPSADWMDWFKLDKWIHAFLYFVLFLTLYIPIRNRVLRNHKELIVFAIVYTLSIGLTTELVQAYLLTDRSGDVPDMIANTFGVLLAIVFVRFVDQNWPWKVLND